MTCILIAFKENLLFRLRYARHDGSSSLLGKDVEDGRGEGRCSDVDENWGRNKEGGMEEVRL